MIYALFWDITERTLVRNYHYSLRNNPEERRYHLLRGGGMKSRMHINVLKFVTWHTFFCTDFYKVVLAWKCMYFIFIIYVCRLIIWKYNAN